MCAVQPSRRTSRARQRVGELQEAGETGARLYLDDPDDGISGGGAFFLLLDEPEVYGLPPDSVVTTRDLPRMWRHVATAAAAARPAASSPAWTADAGADHEPPWHRARHRAGARPEDRARSGDSVQRDGIAQAADSAQTGAAARARWGMNGRGQHAGGRRAELLVVPSAQVDSYYGRPIIKQTVWGSPQIPGYFFLGGLAGASSVLAGVADLTGNRELARAAKVGAAGAIGLSAVALVHDLGRPLRFLNMLRVAKIPRQ